MIKESRKQPPRKCKGRRHQQPREESEESGETEQSEESDGRAKGANNTKKAKRARRAKRAERTKRTKRVKRAERAEKPKRANNMTKSAMGLLCRSVTLCSCRCCRHCGCSSSCSCRCCLCSRPAHCEQSLLLVFFVVLLPLLSLQPSCALLSYLSCSGCGMLAMHVEKLAMLQGEQGRSHERTKAFTCGSECFGDKIAPRSL